MPKENESIEDLVAKLNQRFEELHAGVKQTAETALKEAKDAGSLTAQTRAATDEGLAKLNSLASTLKAAEEKLERLSSQQLEIAQQVADRHRGGGPVSSLGQDVIAHEKVKAWIAAGGSGSVKVPVEARKVRSRFLEAPQMAITSASDSAGDMIWSQREQDIVELPRRRMTIRALLPTVPTTTNLIEYVKQTLRDNQAAPVTEGGQKPESNYTWDLASTPIRTIAHFAKASRQAMDDASQLQGIIDSELRYGLALVEENQLLLGDGTGQNLHGLVPQATAYAAEFAVTGEQHIDILRLAILQVALNEYTADGIVLNPIDWAYIETLKDGENRYLWSNPRGALGTPSMWGLPVVDTQSMTEDEFLVGSFAMAATLYDRMAPEVLISSEDSDNFQKNMLTIRGEERIGLGVKRAASIVTGDFGRV